VNTELPPDWFCSPFDSLLAREGPPAVFLRDPEGLLRFDAEWTRDAYSRAPSPARGARWGLARDRDSGYVQAVFTTSPELLATHPRLEFRAYPTREEALGALAELGRPPIAKQPWS
jgi:hypothetical protein